MKIYIRTTLLINSLRQQNYMPLNRFPLCVRGWMKYTTCITFLQLNYTVTLYLQTIIRI